MTTCTRRSPSKSRAARPTFRPRRMPQRDNTAARIEFLLRRHDTPERFDIALDRLIADVVARTHARPHHQ